MPEISLYGFSFSPFVRKVELMLKEKGIDYKHVPCPPFSVTGEENPHSPLGKIPIAEIDGRWLADSSILCQYLERIIPEPALFPVDDWEFARTLWYEEYIDGGLVRKLAPIFWQRVARPRLFGEETDVEVVNKVIEEELPKALKYLESETKGSKYLVGDRFTLADIMVAGYFINLKHADIGYEFDGYPEFTAYLRRIYERPSFQGRLELEASHIQAATEAIAAQTPA